MPSIKYAHPLWIGNTTPNSPLFDDIYFNPDQGLDESRYVFWESSLALSQINSSRKPTFVIAETGFGTGLNFFITAQNFLLSSSSRSLHFISVEKHPLSQRDILKASNIWPKSAPIITPLLTQYPPPLNCFNTLSFADHRIKLTLLFGDAAECYSQLQASVDIWYLDGFAPSKNPDMWSPELFRQIARLSHPGTTFSTFTAAGLVRRGLQEVGFDVKKQKGFGRKREMLVGTFKEAKETFQSKKPWFDLPKATQPDEVLIIGAGLSGCTTANALAQRGIKVRLFEAANKPATGGSGNRQGALYAKLPVTPTNQGQLHISGYLYSVNWLKQFDPEQTLWSQCGVVQLATSDKEQTRQEKMLTEGYYPEELVQGMNATELSKLTGTSIHNSGLFFPDAGWVSPAELCDRLLDHPNIEITYDFDVTSITFDQEMWRLSSRNNCSTAGTHLIICTAEKANLFSETAHIPLKGISGQVSVTPADKVTEELKTVVCADGYISPLKEGHYCFGATYDLHSGKLDVTPAGHQQNLAKLTSALPSIGEEISPLIKELQGRTSFRCSTPDYVPVVGPVPDETFYRDQYQQLSKDKNWDFTDQAPEHFPNLYINTGHGSKGLITCPISAEFLAAQLCGEPLPLPKNLIDLINPARFIIKELIRTNHRPGTYE